MVRTATLTHSNSHNALKTHPRSILGEGLLDTTGASPFVAYQLYDDWFRAIVDESSTPGHKLSEVTGAWPGDRGMLLNGMDMAEAMAPMARAR